MNQINQTMISIEGVKKATDFKAVLIADLHLHHLPLWRADWNDLFIDRLLKLQTEVQLPLFLLGDVFEVKDQIKSRIINQFLRLIGEWKHDIVWVTGQHDSYIPGRASLEGLRGWSNMTIVDATEFYSQKYDLWFIPFARKVEDYHSMLEKVPANAFVLTHMPIKEALEQFTKDEKMVSSEHFKHLSGAISGDIHKFQQYGNFHYIGAPSQRDWRDEGVDGKIAILLKDNKFIRLDTECPTHKKVTSMASIRRIGLAIAGDTSKYVVKVVSNEIAPEQIAILKQRPNILDVVWEPTIETVALTELEQEVHKIDTDDEVLSMYLDNTEKLPAGVKKNELLDAGLALLNTNAFEEED